jgi:hypoxanthine phosphoribosyltransferase
MPDQVNLFDKTFEKYISSEVIAKRVKEIAVQMNKDFEGSAPVFLPILNGSFFFASDLLRSIDFPYEVSFVKIASYVGMNSDHSITTLIGADESLAYRNIIIIEDIIDTGRTVFELSNQLKEIPVSDIKIASLIFKPESLKYDVSPDYFGFVASNDFLIGYGLDFDKKGRHYKDIYKLKEGE